MDKKILDLIRNPQAIGKESRQFSADGRYFADNYKRLRIQYPDEWVAIYKGSVIGHDRDQRRLGVQLRNDGIAGKVYMDRTYFREEEPIWVLSAA